LNAEHLVRCIECGDFITIPKEGVLGIKGCGCGSLSFDIGRFGSNFGDEAIEVYRIAPGPTH
jgi:hypothetical protein